MCKIGFESDICRGTYIIACVSLATHMQLCPGSAYLNLVCRFDKHQTSSYKILHSMLCYLYHSNIFQIYVWKMTFTQGSIISSCSCINNKKVFIERSYCHPPVVSHGCGHFKTKRIIFAKHFFLTIYFRIWYQVFLLNFPCNKWNLNFLSFLFLLLYCILFWSYVWYHSQQLSLLI